MERMLEEKVKDHVKDPSQYPDIPQGMEKYPGKWLQALCFLRMQLKIFSAVGAKFSG